MKSTGSSGPTKNLKAPPPKLNPASKSNEEKEPEFPASSPDVSSSASNADSFVLVGVGASAGGLEAFTELLKPLPETPGMAFVLIPHLDPKHESVMTELLSRATKMQVRQVHEGVRVKPDCVYVIPPNRVMTIHEGILHLAQRELGGAGPPMPIDVFLRSLAVDFGKNAIGVILSGTASDGTLGIAAIKNEGGITFAQDSKTAKYDSMPSSAVASGYVDYILPPRDIARELVRIRRHPYVNGHHHQPERIDSLKTGEFEPIFRMLRQVRKVDFSDYKPATIRRRIHRRMALARVDNLQEYTDLLRDNPREVEALHADMLINVTSFFRDPEAFEALNTIVYATITKGRLPNDAIRVWVPGCSTGEEVYSHAMTLVEYLSRARIDIPIQIFGTDLSEEAIRVARGGIYKESIAADVTPAQLRRFFGKVEGGYQITKSIRDMCIFATQNVFNDPPFSRMDIVSCRNVLIYLSPVLQRRVIPIFHYALKPAGFLMVGNTEGLVGVGSDLFESADKRQKIYRKKLVASPVMAFGVPREYFNGRVPSVTERDIVSAPEPPNKTPIELHREADRLLLTKYVPAAVVVNERYDIIQVRGRANRYLELPSGKATLNLLKMTKPGILYELQTALDEARSSSAPVRKENVQFEVEGRFGKVNIEVIPFQAPLQTQQSFVIVFEESSEPSAPSTLRPAEPADEKDRQIANLKQELAATKEYLQSIIEALEASNEELQSANEEIQSGNEELQSTNEELQTSKEELESANEELNTVNEEMQHRNTELSQLNNDLMNLLASVNIPMVMLDGDLSIRRMTPQAEEALGITVADLGRPIHHIRLKIDVPHLDRMMLDVVSELRPLEIQVPNGQNHSYRLRITPYRTMENRIEGVVLVMLENVNSKKSSAAHVPSTTRKSRASARRK